MVKIYLLKGQRSSFQSDFCLTISSQRLCHLIGKSTAVSCSYFFLWGFLELEFFWNVSLVFILSGHCSKCSHLLFLRWDIAIFRAEQGSLWCPTDTRGSPSTKASPPSLKWRLSWSTTFSHQDLKRHRGLSSVHCLHSLSRPTSHSFGSLQVPWLLCAHFFV